MGPAHEHGSAILMGYLKKKRDRRNYDLIKYILYPQKIVLGYDQTVRDMNSDAFKKEMARGLIWPI